MAAKPGRVATDGRESGEAAKSPPTRALLFVANDPYYNWALSFLESIRQRNATLPLYCIPFDDQTRRLRSLQRAFGFEMLEVQPATLDAFVTRMRPRRLQHFNLSPYGICRRFLGLQLDYDEIAYFDVDVLLFVDPDRVFGHVSAGKADLVYLANSPEWVYRVDSLPLARQHFPNMQLFSSGAFVTSRKMLSLEEIIATVENNLDLYRALSRYERRLSDQTVLNFVCDYTGKVCRHIRDCDETLEGMAWYQRPDIEMRDGRLIESESGREVACVHWAGQRKLITELRSPRLWPLRRVRRALLRNGRRRAAARPERVGPNVMARG